MDEKDFALLRVLDETHNITKAADKLYMTQSALSKRIRTIEQELDAEILLRSRQGIRFTPEGEKVLAACRSAEQEMERMRRSLSADRDEVCGTLRAGISINYALYRLPDVLASYHKKYPGVRLDITTGHSRHLYRSMMDGALDIAVLRGEYTWDGPQYLLSQESICLIYAEENEGRPLSDYLYISHLTDQEQEISTARWLREHHLDAGTNHVCMDNVTTCVEMVRRGIGWGLLPEIALAGFGGIVRPCTFENGEPYVRKTYIICQRDAQQLPQIAAFTDALKKGRR